MLAVVKAVERFHLYLYGLSFTIVTDYHALVFAINKANLNPRIARWTLRLQNYNFKIQHRAGTKMSHVDALSRVSSIAPNKSIDEELLYRQLTDPQIQAISNLLEISDHEEYTLIGGLVYKKGPDKLKFYVPEPMVNNLLRLYHDDQAHCSVEKTYQGLASNYWFPSMRNRIKEHVGNCLVCMLANTSTNIREGKLQTTFSLNIPFQVVHTDHYGPLIETSDGRKHILILVDAYSRYTWLFAVKSAGTREVIENFRYVFNTFGNPELLVFDRGTAFTSGEFATFLQERNIKHQLVAVAAPWSNGLVERINRFLKS